MSDSLEPLGKVGLKNFINKLKSGRDVQVTKDEEMCCHRHITSGFNSKMEQWMIELKKVFNYKTGELKLHISNITSDGRFTSAGAVRIAQYN